MLFRGFFIPVFGAAIVHGASVVEEYKTWKLHPYRCWTDLRDGMRLLRDFNTDVPGASMTVPACLDACAGRGYSLAGVEFGRECFCGNTARGTNYGENYYPPYTTGRCSYPCAGDSSQICGGSAAMNLYIRDNYQFTNGMWPQVLQSYGGYAVTVCWDDWSKNPRVLKHRPRSPPEGTRMTIQGCLASCNADRWTDAGVEYGRECYCDNSTYPIGQSTDISQCNMPCDGDASQYCGGPSRMIVYSKTW